MAAYAIFIRESVHDQAEMDVYAPLARAAGEGHPLKRLAAYGALDTLEGPPAEGVVLLEFPTVAEARAWYDSPAYQDAAAHRKAGATYRVIIVEGVA